MKRLVSSGLGSRRRCASLIFDGHVRVNGFVATNLTMEVSAGDLVEVDGRPVTSQRTGYLYLLVHKPDGYLSSVTDDRGRQTVLDCVPRAQRVNGLVPAGRLDLHSTGLMLLTNDGELVNRVTHPRYEIEKEYRVALDRGVTPTDSRRLKSGMNLETGTARVNSLRRLYDTPGFHYSVILNEGKKREVRLMFRAIGRQVLSLRRVRIGNLTIKGLDEASVRELTVNELDGIRRLTKMGKSTSGLSRKGLPPSKQPRKLAGPWSRKRGIGQRTKVSREDPRRMGYVHRENKSRYLRHSKPTV